jgi:hypothetical protein
VSRDELLDTWLAAERVAVAAELEVAQIGQVASDPAMAAKFMRVGELRAEADRLFRLLPKRGDGT